MAHGGGEQHHSLSLRAEFDDLAADRPAAGLRDRAETGRALDRDADAAAQLALDADAVCRDRRLAMRQIRGDSYNFV